MADPPLLLTIPEVADELRIDRRSVYRLLKTGALPVQVVHIGASPRIRRLDLEAYLERLALDAGDADQARRHAAEVWLRPKPA